MSCLIQIVACSHPSLHKLTELSFFDLPAEIGDTQESSELITVYRQFFRKGLFFHCKLYPSDSHFYLQNKKKCQDSFVIIRVLSRMLSEMDAPYVFSHFVRSNEGLFFIDPAESCLIFHRSSAAL